MSKSNMPSINNRLREFDETFTIVLHKMKPMLKIILYILLIALFVAIIIQRQLACGLDFENCFWVSWTGFGAFTAPNENFTREKTLWDWLELLIVPVFLALAAWWLNKSQEKTKLQIEADRQKQATLENYFDKMTELIIQKNTTEITDDSAIKSIIRTRTLSLMLVMDGNRKGQALQFIYELGLINDAPILDLNGINLNDADLSPATLDNAVIKGAFLEKANLKKANLRNAVLKGSNFTGANFTDAVLENTDFEQANLSNAIFTNADFKNAVLELANFDGADLTTAKNLTVEMVDKIGNKRNIKLPKFLQRELMP